jgi:hypothetical protein
VELIDEDGDGINDDEEGIGFPVIAVDPCVNGAVELSDGSRFCNPVYRDAEAYSRLGIYCNEEGQVVFTRNGVVFAVTRSRIGAAYGGGVMGGAPLRVDIAFADPESRAGRGPRKERKNGMDLKRGSNNGRGVEVGVALEHVTWKLCQRALEDIERYWGAGKFCLTPPAAMASDGVFGQFIASDTGSVAMAPPIPATDEPLPALDGDENTLTGQPCWTPDDRSCRRLLLMEGMSLGHFRDIRYVLFALNCLPTTVCPQLFARNCLPSTNSP